MMRNFVAGAALALAVGGLATSAAANTISIDFNSGVDIFGNSQGVLYFTGPDGFQVIFTDDDSTGTGGNADGVHITNENAGNRKVGSQTDFVLGAFNSYGPFGNYHTSGIVATFNQGATQVSFDDTDDDGTVKALFAFDQFGNEIARSAFASQTTVTVTAPANMLIYSVEFDTAPGTAGGASDGTYFTIDNFFVEGVDTDSEIDIGFPVPLPAGFGLLLGGGLVLIAAKRS